MDITALIKKRKFACKYSENSENMCILISINISIFQFISICFDLYQLFSNTSSKYQQISIIINKYLQIPTNSISLIF